MNFMDTMPFYMFFTLGILFVFSFTVFIYSIYRYKTIGLIEFSVLFSWFFVFFRPLNIDYCNDVINRNLYFWDADYYVFGVIFSAFAMLVFQIGALYSLPKNSVTSAKLRDLNVFKTIKIFNDLFFFSLGVFVFLWATLFFLYGMSLFPWNRFGTGATSSGLPGFEFVWPILRILIFLLLFLSLFLFFESKRKRYMIIFVLIIGLMIILGRRGILVAPILFFAFVYIYYSLAFKKKSSLQFFNLPTFFILFLLSFIVFLGKSIVYQVVSGEGQTVVHSDTSPICSAISSGHQEFDLLWPAVVNNYEKNYSLFDFVPALFGNFISHENKLLNYPDLYSITDKLMMAYMPDAFLYSKFGISPNFYQFYFSYLGVFSIFIIFLLGVLLRKIELRILYYFLIGSFFSGYLFLLTFNFLLSPIDYFLKYYIVQIVYFYIFIFLYFIYRKIFKL